MDLSLELLAALPLALCDLFERRTRCNNLGVQLVGLRWRGAAQAPPEQQH